MKITKQALAIALPLAVILAGTSFYLLQSDNAESQSSSLQKLWLQAESEIDAERALMLWQQIARANTAVDDGITAADAQKMLFTAMLRAGKYTEAAAQIKSLGDQREQIWGKILLTRSMMKENPATAFKYLQEAATEVQTLEPLKQRSYTLHAIIATALEGKPGKAVFSWDGPELAEKLVPLVASAWHRADAMRLLALHTPEPKNALSARLHKALKIPQIEEKKREAELWKIYQQAPKEDMFFTALDALSGIFADKVQQKEIYEYFKKLLDNKEYSRALSAAQRLDEDRRAASAWARLARYYHEVGQEERAAEARKRSFSAAEHAHYEDDKLEAFTTIAEILTKAGDPALAEQAIARIPEGSKARNRAYGKLIKATAEAKEVSKAEEMLKNFQTEDPMLKQMIYVAVAKAIAQQKRPQDALDMLEEVRDLPFIPQLDNALYAIAKAFAKTKDYTKALEVLQQLKDPRLKDDAGKFIRERQSQKKSDNSTSEEGSGDHPEAEMATRAMKLAHSGDIAKAARLLTKVKDDFYRVEQFRKLAEYQALQTDYYGMLGAARGTGFLHPKAASERLNDAAESVVEDDLNSLVKKGKKGLDIRPALPSALGKEIPPFPDADKIHLSKADLRKVLPLPSPDFSVKSIYYGNNYFVNSKFKVAIGQADVNYSEHNLTPEIIYLERGTATLPQIYDSLRAQGIDDFLLREGNTYTLRRAILVSHNAKLVIDGKEVANLRQSRQAGAILVTSGELHILDTNLIGWDEVKKGPHFLTTANGYDFRPFINGWSGSRIYMGGSNSIALGYKKSKSFGLTMTMGPKKMQDNILFEAPRPSGILADNSFNNSYYGYYAYEADKVVMVGNEYKNGVIYGIDPHDRSRYLTMAFNTAYTSQKKHGIIVSREVDNSTYIGNLSFDNHGSGFMIDRMSNGTYIYGNTGFGNGQDGLTLFESSCNLMASNHFFDNHSMGVRVRNSHDNGVFYNRFNNNGDGGIYVYSNILEGQEAQAHRDFNMDPYSAVASAALVGNYISANGTGILTDDSQAMMLRGNQLVKQSPKNYSGAWFRKNPYLESQYDIADKGAILTDTCPQGKWQPQVTCRWRKQGVFRGDGQRDFAKRIQESPCNQNAIKKKEV